MKKTGSNRGYPSRRAMLCTTLLLVSEVAAFQVGQSRPRFSAIAPQPMLDSLWTAESVATEQQSSLSPVIQGIVNERQEYHIKLGRAMDTLKKDMQTILTEKPGKPFLRDYLPVGFACTLTLTSFHLKLRRIFYISQGYYACRSLWRAIARSQPVQVSFCFLHDFCQLLVQPKHTVPNGV